MNDFVQNLHNMLLDAGKHRLWKDMEWYIKYRNPFDELGHFYLEPTLFAFEILSFYIGFLTFLHAKGNGSYNLWFWLSILGHGLVLELTSYHVEEIDVFWHAQSTFMLFGQRLPLHILLIYPCFTYSAWVACQRLQLSGMSLCAGVGLFTLFLAIPFEILGVKLLWWSWHDTDPNIEERVFWVPWGTFYSYLAFSFSITWIYTKCEKISSSNLVAFAFTSVGSVPLGVLQYIPLYNLFQDIFGIPQSFSFGLLFSVYMLLFIDGLVSRSSLPVKTSAEEEIILPNTIEIILAVGSFLAYCVFLVLFATPKFTRSLGLHQTMGASNGTGSEFDCDKETQMPTYGYPFTQESFFEGLKGNVLVKSSARRPYICEGLRLVEEGYFDMNCKEALTQNWLPGNNWYWICGNDWDTGNVASREEYIFVILSCCMLGLILFLIALIKPSKRRLVEIPSRLLQEPDLKGNKYLESVNTPQMAREISVNKERSTSRIKKPEAEAIRAATEKKVKEAEAKAKVVESEVTEIETPKSSTSTQSSNSEALGTTRNSRTRYNLRKRVPKKKFVS